MNAQVHVLHDTGLLNELICTESLYCTLDGSTSEHIYGTHCLVLSNSVFGLLLDDEDGLNHNIDTKFSHK